jgi:hypothetical protein
MPSTRQSECTVHACVFSLIICHRYLRERTHVDAALADMTRMIELVGPCAVAAALARFELDDDMAAAAAQACERSLDLIEKVAAGHAGDGKELLRTCVRLLMSSRLPLQLFRCFCARTVSLDGIPSSSPRHKLMLQLLTATCRCILVAAAHSIDDVPRSLASGIAHHFAIVRSQDGQPQRTSLVELMALVLSRPTLESTAGASLLLLSLLLWICVDSQNPPDTSAFVSVAFHIMRHSPLSLNAILASSVSSSLLPPPLAAHSCASLLLVLASSCTFTTAAESPTAAAAQSFSLTLLRLAIISFIRSSPLPAATSLLYVRIFNLVATSIERVPPGSIDTDQPLLQSLAVQDDACSCGGLIELYKQHVFKDNATTAACNAMLQSALDAAKKSAVADAALSNMRQM